MQQIKSLLLALVPALLLGFYACVDTDFDEPPTGDCDVNVTANTTIKELKALRRSVGIPDSIKTDIIISGVVISDDTEGNFYKNMVIQDASGGIEIKMDNSFVAQRYPRGREVFIRCKNLLLTDYNGVIQIMGSYITQGSQIEEFGLTEAQERKSIVRGCTNKTISPKKVTLSDLKSASHVDLISTLIQVDGVQFTACDYGKVYADQYTKNDLNREIEDCNNVNGVVVRTSGFSKFAGSLTPSGNGSITAVFSVYRTDKQLYIRDADDVKTMTGARCGTGGTVGGQLTNISAIRSEFKGTLTAVSADKKIRGVVISDRISNNLNALNLYLQDAAGSGIVVRFAAAHCFEMGDEIEIDVSGQELSEFNKLLQVNKVPLSKALKIGSGKNITPRVATVAELNANFDAWESTLVTIKDASITGGATYSGGKTVTDATGNIPMFTQASATFSNQPVPTGKVSITAIVSDFNGKQIILRNKGDVK